MSPEPFAVSRSESTGGVPTEQAPALERSERRRESILEIAVALATEHGLAAATLEAVAAGSGVQPETVVYYYGDRANLLIEVLRELRFRRFHHRGLTLANLPPAGSSVADWNDHAVPVARALIELCGTGRYSFWELLVEASRIEGLAAEARQNMSDLQESVGQLMVNFGVQDGELLGGPLTVMEYALIMQHRALGSSEQELLDDLAHGVLCLLNGHQMIVAGQMPTNHS